MRKGNIEFRYNETKPELVKWQGETCCVIAFFTEGQEEYNMETVGDRFFEDDDAWLVGKHALQFLHEVFNKEYG